MKVNLVGSSQLCDFSLDHQFLRLNVLQLLGQMIAQVVQNAQVFVRLVGKLLRRHRDEAQVGLVGDDVTHQFPGHVRVGLFNRKKNIHILIEMIEIESKICQLIFES